MESIEATVLLVDLTTLKRFLEQAQVNIENGQAVLADRALIRAIASLEEIMQAVRTAGR